MLARWRTGTPPISQAGKTKRKTDILRLGIAGMAAFVLVIMSSPAAFADCLDLYNNRTYCSDYSGCGSTSDLFYSRVVTQNGPCTWPVGGGGMICPYLYTTQGGKTNLSSAGLPISYTNMDHIAGWISSYEEPDHGCTDQAKAMACWVQVGWALGFGQEPPGCSPPGTVDTNGTVDVFVEIYDDSTTPCFLTLVQAAPANGGNASYDARYYTTLPNGQSRYEVYYEVPGSGNIQNLAYGDLNSFNTVEMVSGEVQDTKVAPSNPSCPVMGQTLVGDWNVVGQTASQTTFAGPMNLYQGGVWKNWTSAVVQTSGYIWPPNGRDHTGHGASSNPYQFQWLSNASGGDYTEWEFGGPTQ